MNRFTVPDMSCGHCTAAIEKAVKSIDPTATVACDLETKTVAVETFLSERPDVAKRFLRAFDKSLKFTSEHPRKAAEALNTMVPEVDVDVATGQIGDTMELIMNDVSDRDGLGALTEKRVALTWDWVAQAEKLAGDALDPEVIIDRTLFEAL